MKKKIFEQNGRFFEWLAKETKLIGQPNIFSMQKVTENPVSELMIMVAETLKSLVIMCLILNVNGEEHFLQDDKHFIAKVIDLLKIRKFWLLSTQLHMDEITSFLKNSTLVSFVFWMDLFSDKYASDTEKQGWYFQRFFINSLCKFS